MGYRPRVAILLATLCLMGYRPRVAILLVALNLMGCDKGNTSSENKRATEIVPAPEGTESGE
jgi:hypothetical protein